MAYATSLLHLSSILSGNKVFDCNPAKKSFAKNTSRKYFILMSFASLCKPPSTGSSNSDLGAQFGGDIVTGRDVDTLKRFIKDQ